VIGSGGDDDGGGEGDGGGDRREIKGFMIPRVVDLYRVPLSEDNLNSMEDKEIKLCNTFKNKTLLKYHMGIVSCNFVVEYIIDLS
jgi:hypothetical protein